MRLRLPMIGQGLGPGGNFSCLHRRRNKMPERKAREARTVETKTEPPLMEDGFNAGNGEYVPYSTSFYVIREI
ncbi:hypothetical protein V6N13_057991 [Hibiscus sabdariffa]